LPSVRLFYFVHRLIHGRGGSCCPGRFILVSPHITPFREVSIRIVTFHGRPVSRIHHLPSGRLKLYERFPDGRPRYLRISSEQWVRGRRNEYFDDSVSRSQVCREIDFDYVRSLRHH
jgi:hypothetical protein